MTTMTVATLWKDTRTGIWMLRRRVPQKYLGVAGRAGGIVKISTGTKDDKAAAGKLSAVWAQWEAMVADWEAALHVVALDVAAADKLAAGWADAVRASRAALDPAVGPSDFAVYSTGPTFTLPPEAEAVLSRHADDALRLAQTTATPETRNLLLHAMLDPVKQAYETAWWHRRGLPRPIFRNGTMALQAAPTMPAAPAASVSLAVLYEDWKSVAKVSQQYADEAGYAVAALTKLLGHDDAARITKADVVRWRDTLTATRKNRSVNNRLVKLNSVFARAVKDGKLSTNPVDGLRLDAGDVTSPRPYSDAEAARLLIAARAEATPALRWAHWIMCFTGMRVAEVMQLVGRDVRQDGYTWLIDVNEDDPGKSVKTGKRRHVPLHPALIAEGFTEYAHTVTPDAPLFPSARQQRRSDTNEVGKWARKLVPDKAKAPNHSWRHRMEDELRAVEAPEEVRDAILGHGRKTTGASYGVRGEALLRLHRSLSLIPVPAGV